MICTLPVNHAVVVSFKPLASKPAKKFRVKNFGAKLILGAESGDNSFFSYHLATGKVYAVANVPRWNGRIFSTGGTCLAQRGKELSPCMAYKVQAELARLGFFAKG